MAIKLKDDVFKSIKFDSYNNLDRIELLSLKTGSGSIRIRKYASSEARELNPEEILENRDFHSINLSDDDLKTVQDLMYKYLCELEEFKDGEEV